MACFRSPVFSPCTGTEQQISCGSYQTIGEIYPSVPVQSWQGSIRSLLSKGFTHIKSSPSPLVPLLFSHGHISQDKLIPVTSFSTFRMYGHSCATYESASLRMFRLGRTDTIRSTSVASLKFVQSMDSPDKSVRIEVESEDSTPQKEQSC